MGFVDMVPAILFVKSVHSSHKLEGFMQSGAKAINHTEHQLLESLFFV